MREFVPVVLGVWVFLSIGLFFVLPGRDAAITLLLSGWTLLPVAPYPTAVFDAPVGHGGSMLALAIPGSPVLNRASIIGLGCLLGMILADWPAVRRFRPSRLDLPIVLWCLIPIASTLANRLPIAWGLAQSRHLALAWGVPYLLGRVYLGDNESLRRLGKGWVVTGLLAAPFCLLEFAAQPFLYGLVYGENPYQIVGMRRPILYRPMLFAEDGNQLGIWIATAAVAAVWLRRSRSLGTVLTIPDRLVAPGLVVLCLLCQSHGSIALLLAALLGIWLLSRHPASGKVGSWKVGVMSALILLAATSSVAEAAGLRERVRSLFLDLGKQSFTWRLARYQELFGTALAHPLLGWGRPDWPLEQGQTFVDPVSLGLWLFALGMYGTIGLAVSTLVLVLPVVEVWKWLPARSWLNATCSGATLAAVLLAVNVADSLFNSTLLLPLLAGAGGMNSWSSRRYEAY